MSDGTCLCARCGASFEVTRPNKRFCSERCRKRAEGQRLRSSRSASARVFRTCVMEDCRTEFECSTGSLRRFCSERCRRRAKERRRRIKRSSWPCAVDGCDGAGVNSSQLCDMHADRRKSGIPFDRPKYAQPKLSTRPPFCTVDGCSKKTWYRDRCKRHYLEFHARQGKEWAIVEYEPGGYRSKTAVYGGSYGVVDRFAVFERDDWVCQLCGEPVDPSVAGPDPLAASLDHIVPVSFGGDHSIENAQLAHLGCNAAKGNRV